AAQGLHLADDGIMRWLDAWSERLRLEDRPERAMLFEAKVTCAWLRRVEENRCDAACGSCATRHLSLDRAPFRPIAIANRTDLSVMPDRAANGGEGRIVFALT